MKITKEQAIIEHRKMWQRIAKETNKQKRVVAIEEYFKKYFPYSVLNNSFCCEYGYHKSVNKKFKRLICSIKKWLKYNIFCFDNCKYCSQLSCFSCPIDWGNETDYQMCYNKTHHDGNGLYAIWCRTEDWKKAAKLAEQIAELPERKEI